MAQLSLQQQEVIDSVQVAVDSTVTANAQIADSLNADSVQAPPDVVGEFSREVTETGQLLFSGQWQEVLSRFYEGLTGIVVEFIPKFLSALFVLVLFYLLHRFLKKMLAKVLSKSRYVDAGLEGLLMKTYGVVAWGFIGIMVLAQFGINVTALLAGLSVVGIAVGFAAQDTLQNFISGITVLLDRPFRVGHYIEIEGTYGRVEEITLRSTRVRTLNNEVMIMPNNQMINQKLINYTKLGALRLVVPFGIAYKEYPQEARQIVLALTKDDERLHPNFEPDVVVTELNSSSVDMELRLFIKDSAQAFPIRRWYLEKVREALREADIEIPFPHLQLFIDEAKAFSDLNPPLLEKKSQHKKKQE